MRRRNPHANVFIQTTNREIWLVALCAVLIICLPLAWFYGKAAGETRQKELIQELIAETLVLKAKGNKLEDRLEFLTNYLSLLDAMTLNGRASRELQHDVMMIPDTVVIHDTMVVTE